DGENVGLGSDAGTLKILATGVSRCQANGAPCSTDTDCASGDTCLETGGDVVVQAPLSAAGGGRRGFGGAGGEIPGTGAGEVSRAVDVGGGKQGGGDGDLLIEGGRDLTVGPGSIRADGGSGGSIGLMAGTRARAGGAGGGTFTLIMGTQVIADGSPFGGTVTNEGCDVDLQSHAGVTVEAGAPGVFGQLDVIAHQGLEVDSLASLSALPD